MGRRGVARVDEVADRVYRLGSKRVNWYVVADGTSLTIVDTGLPRYWRQLGELLAAIGRSMTDIEAVVITHADPDHLGNAERIATETGAPVFMHELDQPAAMRQEQIARPRLPPWRPAVLAFLAHAISNGLPWWQALTSLVGADDGLRLEVPGRPMVIHTPGHSAGSVCFAFDDHDALAVGDALVNLDPVTADKGCVVSPELISSNHTKAQESVTALNACRHKTVLFGHGDPWHEGIERALQVALP